jgi:tRNA(Ile)-lysidine synthase
MDLLQLKTVTKLLDASKDCVIGVSGGVDSMVLLHWLANNRSKLPVSLSVMHVDHGINESSSQWADIVNENCRILDIPCSIKKVSLDGFGNNLEYAARQARYKAFCQTGADTIILAHHANDQCESFLLKLFRGSGVRGLKAMSVRSPCWFDETILVLRPMLNVTRSQIELYANIYNIESVTDPSNADNRYDRNYIRNRIWPVISDRFDIADVNTLRSIEHLSEAWNLTNELADLDIRNCTMHDGNLEWQSLQILGYLRIKNVLLRILDLNNVYGFSVNHVEQFSRGLVAADMDSRNELRCKGFLIQKIGKKVIINADEKRAA